MLNLPDRQPKWQDKALCKEADPEAWFPLKGGSTRDAKRICNRCEVRPECLQYALGNDERFGIWGGLSERERRKLKQRGPRKESSAVKQVRGLAAEGCNDAQIAAEVRMTTAGVLSLRRRHGIPAGRGRGVLVAVAPTRGRAGNWRPPIGGGFQ